MPARISATTLQGGQLVIGPHSTGAVHHRADVAERMVEGVDQRAHHRRLLVAGDDHGRAAVRAGRRTASIQRGSP